MLVYSDSQKGNFEIIPNYSGKENFMVVLPSKKKVIYSNGSFHPKIWLLKFKTGHLRIVISSANLYGGDWTIWSNDIWYRDFPLKSGKMDEEGTSKNDFSRYLKRFLGEIKKDDESLLKNFTGIDLEDYDVQGENLPWLIGSCNGFFRVEDKFKIGLARISQIMELNPFLKKKSPLDCRFVYQCSSLGSLNVSFMLSLISKIFIKF